MRILPHRSVKLEAGKCLLHIWEHQPKKGCWAICCMPKLFLKLYNDKKDAAMSAHIGIRTKLTFVL